MKKIKGCKSNTLQTTKKNDIIEPICKTTRFSGSTVQLLESQLVLFVEYLYINHHTF